MNKTISLPFIVLLVSCTIFNQKIPVPDYPDDLQIVTRSEWGWKPLKKTLPEHHVEYITLHHGGVIFAEDKNPIEYLRNLQDWSRAEKPWIDIPYHYMIDLNGIIYEARPIEYPGDTNTDYDPTGHALICIMGNYEEQILSEHQLQVLIDLCAWLSVKYSVPVERIKSHKDYTETLCPGMNIYQYFEDGTIVNRVIDSLKPHQ
ncbi:MAG: N-acetylmuramoyl-L-alanine amidase [Candidatus Marinimicrobia bacterium]|nr:N-acetylmuramoyl-L-alanine amidase [Candidatus Neomarinimicrobiota bacterium]